MTFASTEAAPEPAPRKWARRAITIPGLVLLWLADLAALPALLVLSAANDVARGRRRLVGARFHLALAFTLAMHVVGLLLLLGAWLAGVLFGRERERELDLRVEVWWATTTWRAAMRLFDMSARVEGEDALEGGPLILMSRHASLLDTLLPIVFVSGPHGLVLRYVAKRELLWDPCIDIVGHRLPWAFVRRGGREHAREVALVDALAEDLGANDAVVIFPEGTRFTQEKRRRVLASLEHRDPEGFAHGCRLTHLLPPHPGGPLGLLEHARGAAVVFCAHTGLEGAGHLRDLLSGSLLGVTLHVRYWRVAAEEIPRDPALRLAWLRAWWERLDDWIASRRT